MKIEITNTDGFWRINGKKATEDLTYFEWKALNEFFNENKIK